MSENLVGFILICVPNYPKYFFFPHRILGKKVLIPELWVNESFRRCHIFLNRNISFSFNANKIWIKFKFNIFVSFRSYISTIIYHFVIAVRYIFENLNKHALSTGLCTIINNWRYQLSLQCKQWHKKVIVLCNCNKAGDLVDLKISAKYLQFKPWVLLSVRQFEVNGTQTPVPICHLCNDSIESISKQTLDMLSQHICHHSQVASNNIRDFDCCWHLDGALQLSPDVCQKFWLPQ